MGSSCRCVAFAPCLQKRGASAPMFGSVKVPEAMMGRVIGSGGANLKDMEERLDVRVDVGDDGG